ncbi:MAG: DUF4010 domain-containing protein [Bdellovibrionales bacterium]|nr:DUF4010 domain-containing protein [Bdellovibrionales bacterium]
MKNRVGIWMPRKKSIVPLLTLAFLSVLIYIVPNAPLDPWKLFNPRKVATMIFALSLVQIVGTYLAHFIGVKLGAVITGFLGGLISSTATIASVARKSRKNTISDVTVEVITILSAIVAMLLECILFLFVGANKINFLLLLLFSVPLGATLVLIFFKSRNLGNQKINHLQVGFRVVPILKLTLFILMVLSLSKVLQEWLGNNSLYVLTFIVSLFEIHGSVIANVQLNAAGHIHAVALGHLIAISIFASMISKILIVFFLGSTVLKIQTLKFSGVLLLSLACGWFLFVMMQDYFRILSL